MASKTNKSVTKRFRLTKSGKLIHRKGPKNHLKAKRSSKVNRNAKSTKSLANVDAKKIIREYMPHA